MYISDNEFIRIIDNANECCRLSKDFRVRNQSTGALMKVNIGGLIRAVRMEDIEILIEDSSDFIELARQVQRYKFRTVPEVLGCLKLLGQENSLFKKEKIGGFLAKYIDDCFCKEEFQTFSINELNLIMGRDYFRLQSGDEPCTIWIYGKPVWIGKKWNAEAYDAILTLQPQPSALFKKIVLRPDK